MRPVELATGSRPIFKQLLAQAGVQRPLESVLRLLELRFAPQLSVVSDAAGALALYEFAKALPGTATLAAFSANLGITLKGPLFQDRPTCGQSSTLLGTHTSGRCVIVKVIYSASTGTHVVPLEAKLCTELQLEPWDGAPHPHYLVRASAAMMDVKAEEAHIFRRTGACWAIVTPRCIATVAELPQLSAAAIVAGMTRMQIALEFIHTRGFVHCDVKSDNVLVQHDGSWLLFDFGSTTPFKTPISSLTKVFHPNLTLGTLATARVDWDLLYCMLLVEMNKDHWKSVLMVPGEERVDIEAMRVECKALVARDDASEALRMLAQDLDARARFADEPEETSSPEETSPPDETT